MDSLQLFISLELIFWSYLFDSPALHTEFHHWLVTRHQFGDIKFIPSIKLFPTIYFVNLIFFILGVAISKSHAKAFFEREFHLANRAQFCITCAKFMHRKIIKSLPKSNKKTYRVQFKYFIFIVVIVRNFTQVWPLNRGQCNKMDYKPYRKRQQTASFTI